MQRTILELGSVAGLVLIATLVSQSFFPNRIPFFTTFTTIESDGGPVKLPGVVINHDLVTGRDSGSKPVDTMIGENPASITTADAYAAFREGRAVIIDAREYADYATGHIQGAWSIPYSEFMVHVEKLDTLPLDTLVITYCDGEDCLASMELANDLVVMGFTRVRFYFGGWNSWQNNQYPISTAPAP